MKSIEVSEFAKLVNEGYVVVDTRSAEVFCDGFIEESVSIPYDEAFIDALPELTDSEVKVLLVGDERQMPEILRAVKYAAITNVAGYLAGGFEAWQKAAYKIDMLVSIDADEFAIDYQFDEFYLLDVRSKEDFAPEHVEAAESIALVDLEPILVEMDTQEIYYVYGATPQEAITAASLFKKTGFERLRPVAADFEAIKASGVPMVVQKKKK